MTDQPTAPDSDPSAPAPPQSSAPQGAPPRRGGLGRASAILASGTIVSRGLGFISAAVLAWALGQTNQGVNAFSVANQLPNNVYAIIAGGLLSAVLVPQIVRAAKHADGGERFINRLITLGVVIFLGVTVVATLCAPLLVNLYANSGGQLKAEGLALATTFAYWCLPQIFFYAVYSLLGEVLNARGVFGPFTWAPAINNVVVIASLVVFAQLYGIQPTHDDPSDWTSPKIALVAGCATLGVAAQAIVLVLSWRRTGLRFRPDFRWRGVGLGTAGKAAGWTFGMILITQLAGIVQTNVALLAEAGDPANRVLMTTWLIFMLPHSIIAVSIATPYFTRMSGHARDGDLASVRADLSASLRTVTLLVTGATAAIAAAALPFAAIFGGDDREIDAIALVLLAFLIGLPPFSALFLLQRTFYALGDTRTPFFVQSAQAGFFVTGAFLVPVFADSPRIAISIAVVTAASEYFQAILAALMLRRRLGSLDGRLVIRRFGAYALATLPAAAAGVGILALLGGFGVERFATSDRFAAIVSVAAIGVVSLLVYVGVLALLRVPELRALTAPAIRMLRRG